MHARAQLVKQHPRALLLLFTHCSRRVPVRAVYPLVKNIASRIGRLSIVSDADTPRHKCAGVPLSSSGLAVPSLLRGGSGLLSRGFSYTPRCTCFRLPDGTALCFEPSQGQSQDVSSSVFIPVHNESTMHTAMGAL